MQEEVEQRVVTLIVNCSKLTEQELRKALAKLLEQMKSQKQSKQLLCVHFLFLPKKFLIFTHGSTIKMRWKHE